MRVVLDTNVIVSAAISRSGPPAHIIRAWIDGEFELVVSERVLGEVRRSLSYAKVATRVDPDEANELIEVLERHAFVAQDPTKGPDVASRDAANDFLIALANATSALLVSGDADLLELSDLIPVLSPRDFIGQLHRMK